MYPLGTSATNPSSFVLSLSSLSNSSQKGVPDFANNFSNTQDPTARAVKNRPYNRFGNSLPPKTNPEIIDFPQRIRNKTLDKSDFHAIMITVLFEPPV